MVTIVKISLKRKIQRKTWFKLNLPTYFKPVFQGKLIVGVEVKMLTNNVSLETFEEYLLDKNLKIEKITKEVKKCY